MAEIKMLKSVATREKGVARSLRRHETYDVPEATAKRFVEVGYAERVGKAKSPAKTAQPKPRKRAAKKSKGGAPQNKNAGAAPDDKG